MKRIFLMRHGKSDWSADFGADRERPLAPRGRRAAGEMGRFLAHLDQVPDLVLTSPAIRAHDTVRLAVEAGGWACPVEIEAELYESSPEVVLACVRAQADRHATLLLAGHQPTWSDTVRRFTGGDVRFPTAAIARIDLDVGRWQEVAFGAGLLAWLVTPKLLRSGPG